MSERFPVEGVELTLPLVACDLAGSRRIYLETLGVEFLTPPVDRGGEIRCFSRDSDGYQLEISEVG